MISASYLQDALSTEDMAEIVATYILEEKLSDSIEYSAKGKTFRLKMSLSDLPLDIASALRGCTKETSTVFAGKIGVKVRLLSAKLLTADLLTDLRALTVTHKFSDLVEKFLEKRVAAQAELAKEFYKQVKRYTKIGFKNGLKKRAPISGLWNSNFLMSAKYKWAGY